MSDNREPEVTGAPSADARSAEAVAEAVAGARGPANFTHVYYVGGIPNMHACKQTCRYTKIINKNKSQYGNSRHFRFLHKQQ